MSFNNFLIKNIPLNALYCEQSFSPVKPEHTRCSKCDTGFKNKYPKDGSTKLCSNCDQEFLPLRPDHAKCAKCDAEFKKRHPKDLTTKMCDHCDQSFSPMKPDHTVRS